MEPPSPLPSSSQPSSLPCHLEELYAALRAVVKPEWYRIPDTASEEWKSRFRESLDSATPSSAPPPSSAPATPLPASFAGVSDGSFLRTLSREHQLHLLVKISSILETPWLVTQKRLEGIKEAEKSRPLTLDEVVTYARRLAGSTSAPPETMNISDVVAHQSIYPTWHFLPYPSMEELQVSRLGFLASKPFDRVCFPPEARPKWTTRARGAPNGTQRGQGPEETRTGQEARVAGYEVRLVCQTPGADIVYCVFDGLLAPNTLPPQTLWKEERYNPSTPVFLSFPFPKTLLARAVKPPLQPSRPALLRLNPRGLASSSQRRDASSSTRPAGGASTGSASAAAAESGRGPVGESARHEAAPQRQGDEARVSAPKRGREALAAAGGGGPPKETQLGGPDERGGEIKGDCTAAEASGASVAAQGQGAREVAGQKETPGSAAVADSSQLPPPASLRPSTPDTLRLAPSPANGAADPRSATSAQASSAPSAAASATGKPGEPGGVSVSARAAAGRQRGETTAFHGLMLGSTRRNKRREEMEAQRREAPQESSGSADSSSSSGEDSSDDEEEAKKGEGE
ncbi:mediator complex subunit MED4 [Besnoitia besnoiti]|uniref:Mediator complex subunit MED4 n=1 Tax=Besnoitia besnoiti TaxID=94643 RepID=A0A2A9MIV5_BESBE|nr:mediator complex subunit MED4 [Besnoitia besnoiti]PFH35896.1 mediator complex subunit MED4 [Besnoitia besnoiti]